MEAIQQATGMCIHLHPFYYKTYQIRSCTLFLLETGENEEESPPFSPTYYGYMFLLEYSSASKELDPFQCTVSLHCT